MPQKHILTKEGEKKLKEELDFLTHQKRAEIAEKLKDAISFGDLSENAAYSRAKEEQAFVEGRIKEIEDILRNAQIITDDGHNKKDIVDIGSVVVLETKDGQRREYKIVGKNEADPLGGKISNESLIGKAVLGKRAGDRFSVLTPKGETEYVVKEIR